MRFTTDMTMCREEFLRYEEDESFKEHIKRRMFMEVKDLFFKKYSHAYNIKASKMRDHSGMVKLKLSGFDYKELYELERKKVIDLEYQVMKILKEG